MTTKIGWKASLGMMMGLGLPFFLLGAGLLLAALDVIPHDEHRDAPQWILGAAGLAFLLPGCFFVSAGFKSLVTGGVLDTPAPAAIGAAASAVLGCMAVTVLGVAFFGKAEGFSGSLLSLISTGADVALQRALFALLGLMTAVLAGVLGSASVAALRAQRGKGTSRRTPT